MVTPNQDVLREEDILWHLTNIPAMEKHLSVMDGEPLQEVVKEVIGLYKTNVEPNLSFFQQGTSGRTLFLLLVMTFEFTFNFQ